MKLKTIDLNASNLYSLFVPFFTYMGVLILYCKVDILIYPAEIVLQKLRNYANIGGDYIVYFKISKCIGENKELGIFLYNIDS